MTGQLPVFVYGTLREGEANAGVLDGHVAARRPATLPGHRLHLLEYPCVVEDPTSTSWPPKRASIGARGVPAGRSSGSVRGELVVLAPATYRTALDRLDWLEGFDPADVASSLYVRVAAMAWTDGTAEAGEVGETGAVACWVYVAGARLRTRLDAANLIVSGDWSAR